MTYVYEDTRNWMQKVASEVLKCGKIPQHVAIIMDGNRRFAKANGRPVGEGYEAGFEKVYETLRWSYELGIKEVTIYAFSIENFKRDAGEVKSIFSIVVNNFQMIMKKLKAGKVDGAIHFLANWNKIPVKLKPLISAVELENRGADDGFIFNVAFAYTGRDDIFQAIKSILEEDEGLETEDISPELIEEAMRLGSYRKVDLLIRTSGEVRLSDFMMWECEDAHLEFVDSEWPDFSCNDFLRAIKMWQVGDGRIKEKAQEKVSKEIGERGRTFLEKIRKAKWELREEEFEYGSQMPSNILYKMIQNNWQ